MKIIIICVGKMEEQLTSTKLGRRYDEDQKMKRKRKRGNVYDVERSMYTNRNANSLYPMSNLSLQSRCRSRCSAKPFALRSLVIGESISQVLVLALRESEDVGGLIKRSDAADCVDKLCRC